jgi:hypothetical protein
MPSYKDGRAVLGNLRTGKYIVNIPQLMSQINSKNHEHTDRDGHVKAFPFQLSALAAVTGGVNMNITEIRNTWKLRNSFRKWHALRHHMFREAGVTKQEMGKYGQTIRPFWDRYHANMVDGDNSQVVYGSDPGTIDFLAQKYALTPAPYIPTPGNPTVPLTGEWTYSQFGSVPLYDSDNTDTSDTGLTLQDEWNVMVLGESIVEDTSNTGETETYTTVGMIHAYNLDRQEAMPDSNSGTTIEGPNNPLAALALSGNQAGGVILDITEEQELELPPYDTRDDGYSTLITAQTTGVATTGTIDGRAVYNGMGAAGLFVLDINADAFVTIDVQGEYLCKDY